MSLKVKKPNINFVVCKAIEKEREKKHGNIVIPNMSNEDKASIFKVISVGDGFYTNEGILIPTTYKEGDIVVLPATGGQKLKLDEEEFVIIREDYILTSLEEK